jgi:3-hydroxyisobutyrate dehydrogenase-like beta-hydroxyacid dehydrogenase
MTDNSLPTVGWIGTGRMGFQLAKRLLRAGYDVAVYNRTKAKAEPLAEFGATIVDSPIELAGRDIVFSMVSTGKDLEHVMLGDGGLLTDPSTAPKVIGDSSTVDSQASEQIRAAATERGVGFLATPVSGNPKVIAAGKLTVAVSGPREVYDTALPLLQTWGRGVTYVGDGELSRIVKIAHNVFLGVVIQSVVEITLLAEKSGVKRSDFLAFLNDSVMGSPYTKYKSPALVNLDFKPTFTPVLLQKDLDLGLQAAHELGVVMPIAGLTRMIVASEVGDGNTEQDFASLIMSWAKHSGMAIEPENVPFDDGLDPEE